ncbi:MAG: Hsp20/alpha crystallin family protein, partial [Gemmatimonadales bacterium]
MLAIRTRRPADDVLNTWRRMGRLLDETIAPWGHEGTGAMNSAWLPPCDIAEDKDSLRVTLELPGVRAEDVKLNLENNLLTIRGEKRQTTDEKNERYHRYERSYGVFERSFTLPSTVDPDRIKARVEHGVLTIEIPKA